MAAETGFLIDGTIYEVPTLDSFNIAERHVMYGLCDFLPEDFLREDDESDEDHDKRTTKMGRHPGFWQTLMQVAYQRGNPTVKPGKVALVIENTNYYDAIETLGTDDDEDEGDDAGPLALTTPPDRPSPRKPGSRNKPPKETGETSGDDSTTVSSEETQVVPPTPIGTTRSGTSSPESDTTESVA